MNRKLFKIKKALIKKAVCRRSNIRSTCIMLHPEYKL